MQSTYQGRHGQENEKSSALLQSARKLKEKCWYSACSLLMCVYVCAHIYVYMFKNLIQNSTMGRCHPHRVGVPSSANLQNLLHRHTKICSLGDLNPVRLSITIPYLFNSTPKLYITLNQTFLL